MSYSITLLSLNDVKRKRIDWKALVKGEPRNYGMTFAIFSLINFIFIIWHEFFAFLLLFYLFFLSALILIYIGLY